MKKQIALFSIVIAALIALPAITRAQDAAAPAASKKQHGSMFSGKVSAVDAAAMTVTITAKTGDTTYTVTADTKITKDGQAATLADVAVGQAVSGAFKKDSAGKMTASTLAIGGKKKKKAE